MKPTFRSNDFAARADREFTGRSAHALPNTDCAYQGSLKDFGGRGQPGDRPSFRSISDQYFRNHARRVFAVETALFGLIIIIVAVPVVQSAAGLAALFQRLWFS
jgi:hypothetical protein